MRVRKPGKIRDRLWFLGRGESAVYLLEGDEESILISGGMSYIVPDILQQLEEFGIDETKIAHLLVLHAHFDHVGAVPFLYRRYPGLKVYASSQGWKILTLPKAQNAFNELGKIAAKQMGKEDVLSMPNLEWRDDVTGTTVAEGDRINLGNIEVCIFETPGHSSCSVSAYVPQIKALFPSDGGGMPYEDIILISAGSSFTKFQQSLEKLKDLEVEYLCADHYGYITGKEAGKHIKRSIEVAAEDRTAMEKYYNETKDIDATVQKIMTSYYNLPPGGFLNSETVEGICRQMVNNIAGEIDQAD